MYTGFFGLHSQPFSIAPNPDFLYLSGRHAEALAHLRYGLGDAGGFVLLTGEVGTGKTTVSRALLQELDEQTELAFILNPTLSELELLATICDELRIRYKKSDASLKLLGDKIKNRLLKNHQQGKQTLLIIDEAQHLQPVVLEQLRLLTNLETNSRKLLQVILIGQPELQQLLQRSDLRQLAQRITARYHLMPLTEAEVQQYLSYRLKVAGSERPVFEAAAVRQLYQRSQGIPRLLNLLADRAMLAAFARQKPLVGKTEVQQAAKEILPASASPAQAAQPALWLWLLALVPLMAGLGFVLARVLG
ncbi:AAA family ATPase [Alkalimonas sp. MEB108]|uniref:AAA family ATPase n=1 Tax=Alkalimonas cellulosilytica TaxID=3058395 RepID=A0ABU7J7E4_9GAMM|nr:AAA family ATPase [Alkalimonas sp. MEB108]MEE2002444.1 AAA family ATPase [Alkalimonas sp. MEB108]